MIEVKHNVGPTLSIAIPTLGRPVPLQWALNFKSMSPPINFNCDLILSKERKSGMRGINLPKLQSNADASISFS
jgi:hypothetical protein